MENKNYLKENYEKDLRRKLVFIPVLILVLVAIMIFSTKVGSVDTKLGDVLSAIKNGFSSRLDQGPNSKAEKVIFLLRLPRVVLGVFAGMGLAMAGAAMQAITKNPMVSPFTIGISSAAALGASIAIVFNLSPLPGTNTGIVLNAFIAALICAICVYLIAKKLDMSPEAIVLSGIAINYLFSAFTSTIQFIADEHKLSEAVRWTFGSLNGANWTQLTLVGIIGLISFLVFMAYSWKLNIMVAGGDEVGKSLGLNPQKIRLVIGIFSVLLTSAIVSFVGVIGFIGLVGPHMARSLVGGDNRFLIPYSGLIGGLLVLISDTLGRTLMPPITIPVGIIISYVGVPLFIHLIIGRRRKI